MILDYLLKNFPEHVLAGDVANYRKVILSLAATGQPAAYAAT
jgi:hypothetical protein